MAKPHEIQLSVQVDPEKLNALTAAANRFNEASRVVNESMAELRTALSGLESSFVVTSTNTKSDEAPAVIDKGNANA